MSSRSGLVVESGALDDFSGKNGTSQQPDIVAYDEFCSQVTEEPIDALDRQIGEMTKTVLTRNRAQLLSTGPAIFSAMEQDMLDAKRHIDWQVYSLANDSTGWQMSNTLLHAAHLHREMPINGYLDRYGAFLVGMSDQIWRSLSDVRYGVGSVMQWLRYRHLRAKHIPHFFYDPTMLYDFSPEAQSDLEAFTKERFDHLPLSHVVRSLCDNSRINFQMVDRGVFGSDHSKILVADDVAHVQSVNVEDCYSGGYRYEQWIGDDHWRDYSVRLEGPAASVIRHDTWGETQFPSMGRMTEGSPVRFLRNEPGVIERNVDSPDWARKKQVSYAFWRLISEAEESIVLDHCYYMDEDLMRLLQDKARTISVTALVGAPENFLVYRANKRFLKALSDCPDIRVLKSSDVSHAKLTHVDGRYTLVGSQNANKESLDSYGESAVLVTGDNPFQQQVHSQLKQLDVF